ncbi:MAG: (2Fe-2S)-binding protein [Planctomycetota bacterium]|nr:MAG: (2Fe-2S)-binding protein [Planctomycetota bacterium]
MIQFWLNDQLVQTNLPKGMLVLDYLRQHRRLCGTKEGCKEGDCGACMVLVGKWWENQPRYEAMTSCLIPLGEMESKHLLTIEGLNLQGKLNLVQQAMAETGGAQCGFCTPGFIVSMMGYLFEIPYVGLSYQQWLRSIEGNLCRCTGYASILRAGKKIIETLQKEESLKPFLAKSLPQGPKKEKPNLEEYLQKLVDLELLPPYLPKVSSQLKKMSPNLQNPPSSQASTPSIPIAGGTDLYVQQGEKLAHNNVNILRLRPDLERIEQKDNHVVVGALCTFENFARSQLIRSCLPAIEKWMFLIASLPIRRRATIGGNIVNASPIGDMTILLLALEAEVCLENGKEHRYLPLKNLFLGYKQLAKQENELLTHVRFPYPTKDTKIHFEKVSKRLTLDIASVNSAIRLKINNDQIVNASLSMGGVAPIPLYLKRSSQFLQGKKLEPKTLQKLLEIANDEISPISDIRGSASYKRLLARNLILAHFLELCNLGETLLEETRKGSFSS